MRVRAGQRIDRYELLAPLGAGGQAAVWKAADLLENRALRALKLVPRERATPEAFERARREAHALAQARHPALVTCHGIFEDLTAGITGIVLDLVEGEPLADVAQDPRMTPAHRAALLEQIAEALAFVHERKIVHRDLKPDNILVTERFWEAPTTKGAVKLVDFGISVELGNPRPLTATGAVLGTTPYLAPELIAPELFSNRRSGPEEGFGRDLFAFGVLATELLLGRHPTGLPLDASLEAFAAAYRRIVREGLAFPQGPLEGPWGKAARACLCLDPAKRPQNGAELLRVARGQASRAPETDLAMVQPLAETRTAPMPAPKPPPMRVTEPSSPRIEALRPPPPSIPAPPPASLPMHSSQPIVVGLGVGVALACVIAVWVWMDRTPAENAEPAPLVVPSAPQKLSLDPVETERARPRIQIPKRAAAEVPSLPFDPAASCPAICCGGRECATTMSNTVGRTLLCDGTKDHCNECASKRACIPWGCTEHIDPNGRWLLRYATALAPDIDNKATELRATRPRAEVCLRPSARREEGFECTPVSASPAETYRTRTAVTTQDLHVDGVDVQIREGGEVLAERQGVRYEDKVRVTALCLGLVMREIVSRETLTLRKRSYQVTVHLDDAD